MIHVVGNRRANVLTQNRNDDRVEHAAEDLAASHSPTPSISPMPVHVIVGSPST